MVRAWLMRLAIVTAAVALGGTVGCGTPPAKAPTTSGGAPPYRETTMTPGVTPLGTVEVREYKGQRLDPVSGFVENSIKGPQHVEEATYRLKVTGLVDTPREYTYSEVTSGFPSYEKVTQLNCVEGWSERVLWEGVLVRDILKASGVQSTARSVIITAADGYTNSYPVAYFYNKDIIMAYAQNGLRLPPERGFPFQVVAEDKWGYKWCKWVVKIELSSNPDPGGFWEDRGYSNSGDLSRPFFAQ